MVAIKNATYVGKGPGIPTTAVPAYKANDPYYPKGSLGAFAEGQQGEPPAEPVPTPVPTPEPVPTPTPTPPETPPEEPA